MKLISLPVQARESRAISASMRGMVDGETGSVFQEEYETNRYHHQLSGRHAWCRVPSHADARMPGAAIAAAAERHARQDIKVSRDLIRGGQVLKIDLLDSIILGVPTPEKPLGFVSLREMGYFYSAS